MRGDELRCQDLWGERRGRGTAQGREKRPPHLALGAGRGGM